ncbi:MAG: AMP-binding protein [Proteobacteria bacterium]|nr:AMP-binding protein [Pseudomonadota bacterium]
MIEQNRRVPRRVRLADRIADRLIFRRIRERLGGDLRLIISGGSALNPQVTWWFFALKIPVLEGWGLTETAAPATVNLVDDFRVGTVGKPIPGTEVKLDADGEILVRGPGVFTGYFKDEKANGEAFTSDGWFRTGDIGEIDDDGYLKITDRKKELIITAGGKNIPPVNIEKRIERSPYVMQAVAIGDDRPYLVGLVAPDDEELPALAKKLGLPATPLVQMVKRPEVVETFRQAIVGANRELPPFEQIKRFAILPGPLSVETGELTPTLKLKRRVIKEKYGNIIEELYQNGGINVG